MAYETASGAKLKASAALPATYDSVGYGALTMITVGEVTNIGAFGKVFATVTHNSLEQRGTQKSKGSFNNGQIQPQLALDNSDAGQDILRTAVDSDDPIAMSVELRSGDEYFFAGLVMSMPPNVAAADDIVMSQPTIEIDHNPIILVEA